ncbi:MAG TPA: amidohydrolase [Candidatus Eremiobacteraeota bacterium]|nr:amidohydrolase [Candidatus Eremiobacteraeota bacterium]
MFLEEAQSIKSDLISWRRLIHQYPETGFKEKKTASLVEDCLKSFGIEYFRVASTGIVGLIKGGGTGKTVALRADMDALSIQEQNDVSYASKIPGVMHACGHDAHTAILIGTAKILSEKRNLLKGNVKLIFQPAEEGPGGALPMIEAGVLDNPSVDAVFALHMASDLDTGKIGLTYGQTHAASSKFIIVLKGRAGHISKPHKGVDAIIMAAEVIQALQRIRTRQVDPMETVLIGIGRIKGGDRYNIIPERVEIEGTLRTLSMEVHKKIPALMEKAISCITSSMGGEYELTFVEGYPGGINHPDTTKFVENCGVKLLGRDKIEIISKPSMGGEDFSCFLQKVPGTFIRLGGGGENYKYSLHHPKFDINEDSLVIGAALFCQIVFEFLG